ncbi:hypothetical protein PCASD_03613 [Puccinia coronata f. sp. avenae]|uniref:Uncharacterized protein n=1 Tax=Puccinia coronata f. sp. avenae TaxID=200324 RepID=A0A2N5VDP9_9BASI|nr:hypothetical protein PCASD_03613 [Puccinia coronata f. sp. avenae]
MSNSADNSQADTPSTHSVPRAIRQQRGLISQNFRNLGTKYEEYYAPSNQSYTIVPIQTLPKLLDSSELREDLDGSKLQLITEIQSEIDQSLDQLFSIATGIQRRPASTPPRADDNDSREFKEYRRERLSIQLSCLNQELHWMFHLASSLIGDLKNPPQSHCYLLDLCHPGGIVQRTTRATETINGALRGLASHEFILIQEDWALVFTSHDEHIAILTQLIHRATNHPEPENESDFSESDSEDDELTRRLRKHAIPLAQSFIPVLKLSRLFFRKLAQNELNKTPSRSFTDMNSYQLDKLSESAEDTRSDLFGIHTLIVGSHEINTAYSITSLINRIINRFDSILLLVIIYIIPLLANPISSQPNDLQNSLVAWNRLFMIAAHNCTRAAQACQIETPPSEPDEE